MDIAFDGGKTPGPTFAPQLSSEDVNMDLTMCGLHVTRAEELVRLYDTYGNWNDVKQVWFENRLLNRSTRGSAQKIYRILTSRLKNAPPSLPNPGSLPTVFDSCTTARDKAQILYLYLAADDALVRYVIHEYVSRFSASKPNALDFSNEALTSILDQLEYADGTSFDYADSTIERWCEGFRSVMREIGVLEDQQAIVGEVPSVGDSPLLVAMGYSYEEGGEHWFTSPNGLLYLFQPNERWAELYDRAADTNAWEWVELHARHQLRPCERTYSWIIGGAKS